MRMCAVFTASNANVSAKLGGKVASANSVGAPVIGVKLTPSIEDEIMISRTP